MLPNTHTHIGDHRVYRNGESGYEKPEKRDLIWFVRVRTKFKIPLKFRKQWGWWHVGLCTCAVRWSGRAMVAPQRTTHVREKGWEQQIGAAGHANLGQLGRLGGVRGKRRRLGSAGRTRRADRRATSGRCAATASRYPQLRLSASRARTRYFCPSHGVPVANRSERTRRGRGK